MRAAAFIGALAIGAIALAPQVDRLVDASFAWHMAQHLTLLFVVPLLLVVTRPFDVFVRFANKAATATLVRVTRPLHALVHPALAFAAFTGYLWFMHFSPLYEGALEHPALHAAEHGLLLLAGTLFWLPVVAPPPLKPLSYPVRLFYLLLVLPQGALLAFALDAARAPLYAHYANLLLVPAALADQRNGAAVMWIGGGLILFTAFLVTFAMWARRESVDEWIQGEVA